MALPDSTRWLVLLLACLLLFGNYYAYDLPAALNIPLQTHLNETDATYEYQINIFYSVYSIPNVILPFITGWLVDVFGTKKLMLALSACVCLGQCLFALGVTFRMVWVMYLGRAVFGIGGESLSVAQTTMTTKWFRGKELAFALGLNLSIARLGSVFNDFISPQLGTRVSVPFAMWFGLIICLLSFSTAVGLSFLDSKAPYLKSDNEFDGERPKKSSGEARERLRVDWNVISAFPAPFWQLMLVMVLMYATVVPFNTIHSAFLQLKWYPDEPITASQVMAIPDTISAVLVPFVGAFVDFYGHRVKVLTLCSVLMATVHLVFGLSSSATVPSPIPLLVVLGLAYAMLLTFWPCIPLVVGSDNLATAFGLMTSALNISLFIFPIIVATLTNAD
ncbi:hypothetical protein HK102_009433, partial [Quaeritorhiza haematococci]